ncbi:retrovirus-related Pol polyprotein from type-2 retrotransposable element R2DM [Trichonephila inaurata madagascariensis]|uniref:Retrovirus-related Pol polyprotein from type-2 retrotransposable element R2DM n=1 Tax=Trichonephila inaurata madagascariensis TaxID=2747483 RepID=A0A8X7C4F8_9ARAC|nr:retrovirus-related Pol polyprotein from type-2 retrotransposable element R2DM [Trichonephila inaurata madagascariensis]
MILKWPLFLEFRKRENIQSHNYRSIRLLPILCGVKQGCPLSGILFNLVLNDTLKCVQGDSEEKVILAFADDIGLLAKSELQLQDLLNRTVESIQQIALHINTAKCTTLHLSGSTLVGSRPSAFFIQGVPIKALSDNDFYNYLGKPVGFSIRKDGTTISDAFADGACDIPEISRDADLYLIDTAFKLLSSNGEDVTIKALAQLTRTVRHRIHRMPTCQHSLVVLWKANSDIQLTPSKTPGLSQDPRLVDRLSHGRLWKTCPVSFDGNTITTSGWKKLLKALHNAQRLHHTEHLISQRSQGKFRRRA